MNETLFAGAHFQTLSSAAPEAEALAVRGERILAAGSVAACRSALNAGYTEVDLSGGWAVPGLTDCHIHLSTCARNRNRLQLGSATTLAQAQQLLADYARHLPDGAWVLGGGFDANEWKLGREVHRDDLDPYSAGHPVALQNHDAHSTWVNTAGLEALGIDERTPQPAGGRIETDDAGPTGLLRETAAHPARAIGDAVDDLDDDLLADTLDELLARGITSIHDIDGIQIADRYQALRSNDRLGVRVHQLFSLDGLSGAIEQGRSTGDGDHWLRAGPVKLFSDGALGSHTAALSSPYSDQPDNSGIGVLSREELTDLALTASQAGIAIAVHAIGDAANTRVLDAVAEVRRRGIGPRLRHRIEHTQHLRWPDVERFADLGVIASMQPIQCVSDLAVVRRVLGDRRLASYAWADLAAAGTHVAFGSDAPVESFDPVLGLQAATTRTDPATGDPDNDPANTLSPRQALRGYAIEPAYASSEEHDKGRLGPGFLADFAVFDADLTDPGVAASGTAQATTTVVGGRVAWDRSGT